MRRERKYKAIILALNLVIDSAFASLIDFRELTEREFFADTSILQMDHDWFFTGPNLDSSTFSPFNKSWERFKKGFFGRKFDIDAYRRFTVEDSTTSSGQPSFTLTLFGEYKERVDEYDQNLIHHNNRRTKGERIPNAWRTNLGGYMTPTNATIPFRREYSLTETKFNIGEFGCPRAVNNRLTAFCQVEDVWFATNARMQGHVKANGDLEHNDVSGQDESVTINLKADQDVTLKVNGFTLEEFGSAEGTSQQFKIQEDKSVSVDFEFKIKPGIKFEDGAIVPKIEFSIGPSIKWEKGKGDDTAQLLASYNEFATMDVFASTASAGLPVSDHYIVDIVNIPQMYTTISGHEFTTAFARSIIGLSQLEETHKVIASAVEADPLLVRQAKISPVRKLSIPPGEFVDTELFDFNVFGQVMNVSLMDITLEELFVEFFEDDFFKDDDLAVETMLLDALLSPGERFHFNIPFQLTGKQLNETITKDPLFGIQLERGNLEFVAKGTFTYSDRLGTLKTNFKARSTVVPEPGSLALMSLGLAAIGFVMCRRRTGEG